MKQAIIWATAACVVLGVGGLLRARTGGQENVGRRFHKLLTDDYRLTQQAQQARESGSPVAWTKLRLQMARQEAAYKRFLADHPTHARAMVVYGNFVYDDGRTREALDLWQKAIAIDPANALAYNNLASHYLENGRAADALRYYQKAVELEPHRAIYHFNWATAASLYREDTKAVYGWDTKEIFRRSLEQFRVARELSPQEFGFAKAYAEEYYRTVIAGNAPDWAEAYNAWSYCLNQALTEADRQTVYGNLARVCMRLERLAEARMWIDKMTLAEMHQVRSSLDRKLTRLAATAGAGNVSAAANDAGEARE
jgi:Flp pilus assembly protein TadD